MCSLILQPVQQLQLTKQILASAGASVQQCKAAEKAEDWESREFLFIRHFLEKGDRKACGPVTQWGCEHLRSPDMCVLIHFQGWEYSWLMLGRASFSLFRFCTQYGLIDKRKYLYQFRFCSTLPITSGSDSAFPLQRCSNNTGANFTTRPLGGEGSCEDLNSFLYKRQQQINAK